MRWLGMMVVIALLGGCGSSEVGDAVDICKREVDSRIADQMGQVDAKDMKSKAEVSADGTIVITSVITYRAGTSDEGTQPYTCKVSTKNANGEYEPRVIDVQIDPLGYKKSG